MKFSCPYCRQHYRMDELREQQTVLCRHCGHIFAVVPDVPLPPVVVASPEASPPSADPVQPPARGQGDAGDVSAKKQTDQGNGCVCSAVIFALIVLPLIVVGVAASGISGMNAEQFRGWLAAKLRSVGEHMEVRDDRARYAARTRHDVRSGPDGRGAAATGISPVSGQARRNRGVGEDGAETREVPQAGRRLPEMGSQSEASAHRLSELKDGLDRLLISRSADDREEKRIQEELSRISEAMQRKDRRCYEFCICLGGIRFQRMMHREKVVKMTGYFEVLNRTSWIDPETRLWKKVDVKYVCTRHDEIWTQQRADRYKRELVPSRDLAKRRIELENSLRRIRLDRRRIVQIRQEIAETERMLGGKEKSAAP